jgi:hypothetical protein
MTPEHQHGRGGGGPHGKNAEKQKSHEPRNARQVNDEMHCSACGLVSDYPELDKHLPEPVVKMGLPIPIPQEVRDGLQRLGVLV